MLEISYENFVHHSLTCLSYSEIPRFFSKTYYLFWCPKFHHNDDNEKKCDIFEVYTCIWDHKGSVCIAGDKEDPQLLLPPEDYGRVFFIKKYI